MATKKKATNAPASKKLVTAEPTVVDKKEAAKIAKREAAEQARLARIAARAQRTEENRARWKADKEAALQGSQEQLSAIRRLASIGGPGSKVKWTEELSEALFELIATGHGMQQIAEMEGMPSLFCMLKWRADETHPFCKVYTRAKDYLVTLYEEQAHLAAIQPELFVLKTRKQVVTRDGDIVWVTENRTVDNVARSSLKLQAYQWTLSHLKPKKHGAKPDPSTGSANEQLKGLFDALMAGPVDTPKKKPNAKD